VSIVGNANHRNGTFTVSGSGTSISGTADQFNYAYHVAGTSYTITARVVSMTNSNSGAQAGVTIRETLDTGSIMANINITPSNGVTWVYRTTRWQYEREQKLEPRGTLLGSRRAQRQQLHRLLFAGWGELDPPRSGQSIDGE
jgi:hypothetical protein